MQHMPFISNKTQCMIFKPSGTKFDNPCLKLGGCVLEFYTQCKYLGTFIELSGNSMDINRQLRKFYANVNTLMTKFKKCSQEVK